jgi:hypothetical protein
MGPGRGAPLGTNRFENLVESYRLATKEPPPPGNILVHSPRRMAENSRHFRAWWAVPGWRFALCDCGWRPDLGRHYVVQAVDAKGRRRWQRSAQ